MSEVYVDFEVNEMTAEFATMAEYAKGEKGDKGDKGDQGIQGEKGADGHTPVKGVDYFTEADKEEMVNDVLAAKVLYVDDEGYICLKESENG